MMREERRRFSSPQNRISFLITPAPSLLLLPLSLSLSPSSCFPPISLSHSLFTARARALLSPAFRGHN